jgi:Domain of unknown function (DUF4340)
MFRGRSTLIYLVVALGLVCYVTFIDKKIPGTAEEAADDSQLFKFDQEAVTGLEIGNVHGSFVFQKKNDHWEITSPVHTLADDATVAEVIGQIADSQPQRTIPLDGTDAANEKNLKEWGLDPAAERALIHLKDRSLELMIGRKVAINDSVYARTSGRHAPVRVVPDAVKIALEKTLSDFRSRNVFDFAADRVTRIATRVANTATTPAQECEADLKDGKWMLQKPLVARASASDVANLLNKVLGLRVTTFVTDDPGNLAQYGLTSPTATLSATVGTDDESVLQIGSPVPGKPDQVYAQRLKSNAIVTLEQSSVDQIINGLPDVRDRHVLPFDSGTAAAVSFYLNLDGTKTVQANLKKEKGIWQVVGDAAGTADVGKVTDLLTRLQQLETTPVLKDSAPDLKPFGLDKPVGKITITTPDSKTPLTLSIGKTENNLVYVRNSIEPFIYTVAANTFDFLGDNLSYRDKRAIDLVLSKVKSMTVTVQGEPSLTLDRSLGGTWSAENAKNRMVDTTRADTQASLLCQLQAQTWLGAATPADGLDKPVLTIALQTDLPTATVLKIGAPLPDGSHAAQILGSPNAFELADADYGLLNASSLQMIPAALNATNAAPANAVPSTNTPTATNSATANAPAPEKHKHKKKHSEE